MTDRYERIREALALLDSGDYCERAIGYSKLRRACDPDTIRELLAERDQLAAALEAAREYGWQPIETAPKDGTRVLLRIEWSNEPVVGEFTNDRWWACTEHHEVWCGTYCLGGKVGSYKDMKPIAWARIPPIDAAIAAANGGGDE